LKRTSAENQTHLARAGAACTGSLAVGFAIAIGTLGGASEANAVGTLPSSFASTSFETAEMGATEPDAPEPDARRVRPTANRPTANRPRVIRAATPAAPTVEPRPPVLQAAASPARLPGPSSSHRVRSGDTLWALSKRYNTTVSELVRRNGLDPETSLLEVGQVLQVPSAEAGTPVSTATELPPPEIRVASQTLASTPVLPQIERFSLVPGGDAIATFESLQPSEIPNVAATATVLPAAVPEVLDTQAAASVARTLAPVPEGDESEAIEASAAPTARQVHRVRRGETLYAIARRYGVTVGELTRANSALDSNDIAVGRTLVVPTARLAADSASESADDRVVTERVSELRADVERLRQGYRRTEVGAEPPTPDVAPEAKAVQSTAPESVANLPDGPVAIAPVEVGTYNRELNPPIGQPVAPELPPLTLPDNRLPDGSDAFTGYIWPARGVLTSGYGMRWGRMHRGVDIAAPVGTPIVASGSGVVLSAGWNSGGFGNLVKLRHPDGSVTYYAHNSRILVRRGQRVRQGQTIAEMGSTGRSTGPHLHFEIHPTGRGAVNPISHLPRER